MFLIELSVDGLSYLKRALKSVPCQGDDVPLHAAIHEALQRPIIGEKLVADIQQKALNGGAHPQAPQQPAHPDMPAVPQHPPMPEVIPAYPLPGAPQS